MLCVLSFMRITLKLGQHDLLLVPVTLILHLLLQLGQGALV